MKNAIFIFFLYFLQLSEIVNQGELVSDEIIISLLSKRVIDGKAKGESGFILDGFPRTISQAVSIFTLQNKQFQFHYRCFPLISSVNLLLGLSPQVNL